MHYLNTLNEKLDKFHLLDHPFYIAWNKGELNQAILKDYAETMNRTYHFTKRVTDRLAVIF